MSTETKKSSTSGRVVFLILLALAFAGAVWSLVTGKSDISKSSGAETASGAVTQTETPVAGGSTEDNQTADENRMVFGQVPQSTDNSQADEAPADKAQAQETQSAVTPAAETQATEQAGQASGSAASATTTVDASAEELLLVNKTHHLDKDYWPDDLVTVSSCVEGVGDSNTKKLRKVAADALEELIAGAAADGYQIKMRTGFRSYDYQVTLFNSYAQKNGEEAANKFSARAGESEHQSGLCCDVSSPSVGWAISYEYDDTPEGKWLEEHGHEYGFIIRYLPGKEDITGYNAEPWHIRYVGIDAATEIYEKGICFEEYLGITD